MSEKALEKLFTTEGTEVTEDVLRPTTRTGFGMTKKRMKRSVILGSSPGLHLLRGEQLFEELFTTEGTEATEKVLRARQREQMRTNGYGRGADGDVEMPARTPSRPKL
jgi:hypothetical protein